ncbi:NAD(P)H-dependent oxidoreductase subunit E [Actinomycetospora endophytica]|uniref:NAD(P)H-dependent oxidoreductase subunit E n=1 Tax=Actinomycetospora endophytica TaxID=2291215 RepID=A0ABS8PC24_9PSEU|nr:NAD(P)H-dependent oxidoreductase subunit E [Actinomycetospora endophytica]MCD2194529.1 NAD(P)H-dependent oxidoreductase subunit E [Actinomycetospora endophytica]
MDLRLLPDAPTDVERTAIDAVVPDDLGSTGERRDLLLPAFHAVMDAVGWISRGALGHVCERLQVPPAEAYGVATFYALFSVTPRAPRTAHVCDDVACAAFGGDALCAALEERLGPAGEREDVTWTRSPCLGMCERAPAVFLQRAGDAAQRSSTIDAGPEAADGLGDHQQIAPADVTTVLEGLGGADVPGPDPVVSTPQSRMDRSRSNGTRPQELHLLSRVGIVDPADLDSYRAAGGYSGLRRALAVGSSRVVDEITVASLTGRGGAAFPTGTKWSAVAGSPDPDKYLICNADESEPGTFKDRVLMEADPFALVEAMTVAGIAVGAHTGYLYIRGEYPAAERAVRHAIEAARHHRLLGDDVMGSGRVFDIEVRRGAGAYICGEETALMNSLEGHRGEPRAKPPFPTVAGLFAKPTVINNVETLINVLRIVAEGGPAFAEVGSGRSTGTKLFCLSGVVARPGVYEIDMGTTLRELLELAGGVPDRLRTILLGGAAGTFVTPDQLDVRLTLEDTREIGATLGSGVVLCLDESVDMARILRRIAGFFRDESCGQCVPCRVGTVRQEEALARIVRGREIGDRKTELQLLTDVDRVMTDASICGLGQTAASAVRSALKLGLIGENA